jgi:hypothetical protein
MFFSPVSAFAGEKENSVVQNGIVSVFFFMKRKYVIWKNPKIGYDSCPLFIMLTEQKPP